MTNKYIRRRKIQLNNLGLNARLPLNYTEIETQDPQETKTTIFTVRY